jgi:predicted nucleotidyltransferase
MVSPEDADVDLDGMIEYLEQTPVVFALLFGSHARGTAESKSDVDVALRLSEEMDDRERFRTRNRIDAELQQFADGFVDVSDIDALPTEVAYATLQDGVALVGDESTVRTCRERVADAYERTADDRERERREFIDRLARGDA